jgi:predicted RNase H-like HicB family nuclease
MRYVVVVEKSKKNYGAYVPDLPGCVAVAETKKGVLKLIREAIALHVERMREEGLAIPQPTTSSEYVEVAETVPSGDPAGSRL